MEGKVFLGQIRQVFLSLPPEDQSSIILDTQLNGVEREDKAKIVILLKVHLIIIIIYYHSTVVEETDTHEASSRHNDLLWRRPRSFLLKEF